MGTINDLINRLEGFSNDVSKLKGASASILPNSNGMLEKECANKSCLSTFFVNEEDWKNILRDEEVFCPICTKPNLAKTFYSSVHLEAIKNQVTNSIKDRWQNGTPINTTGVQLNSSNAAEHLYSCNHCHTRFGTISEAVVCPSCGYNIVAE
jgi:rubrerythrin